MALKERSVVNDKTSLAAVENRSGDAILGRSETELLEKRGLDRDNIAAKRQDGGFDSVVAPL